MILESVQSSPQKIRELVGELSKQKPDEVKVKQLMKQLNIPYSKDPIERLNMVFQVLSPDMESQH